MTTNLSQTEVDSRLRIVDEHLRAENAHDVDAIMRTFSDDPIFILNGNTFSGRDAVRGMYESFGFGGQGGFARIQVETVRRFVSDEAVVVEAVLRAEHTNAWQGIPATGRTIEVPLCAIFPFDEAGRLRGERVYLDGAIMLKQLGILP